VITTILHLHIHYSAKDMPLRLLIHAITFVDMS